MTRLEQRVTLFVKRLDDRRVCALLLGAAMAIYAVVVLVIGRGETLFVDEKDLFYVDRGLDAHALLSPLNGHLILGPRLIYAFVFGTFGADFTLIQLFQAIGGSLAAGLLYVFALRRVGPLVALAMALLLLFLGSAWEVTFIESGISNSWSLAAGIGALLALDRGDRVGDLAACALLAASIAFVSFGLSFAAGAAVLILLSRDGWRRLWVVVVPLALYLAWFAWRELSYAPEFGDQPGLYMDNLLLVPSFLASHAAAVAGAMSGLDYDFTDPADAVFETHSVFGPLIAVVAAVALFLRLRRRPITPMLWATMTILFVGWLTLALAVDANRSPTTVRYAYSGAVFVLLIGAEAARGAIVRPLAKATILAVVVLAILGNLARLTEGAGYYREFSTELRAQLTAIELARDHVDPSFVAPSGPASFHQIRAEDYLAAVDRIGSLAFSPAEIEDLSEEVRASLDATSAAALRIAPTPAAPGAGGTCQRVEPTFGFVAVAIAPSGVAVESDVPASLAVRRYADETAVPIGELAADDPASVQVAADGTDRPWTLVVTGAEGPVSVCR